MHMNDYTIFSSRAGPGLSPSSSQGLETPDQRLRVAMQQSFWASRGPGLKLGVLRTLGTEDLYIDVDFEI